MSLVDDMNAKLEQSSSFFNSTGLLLTGWIIYLPPVLFLTIFFIIPVLMISFTSIYPRISVSSELGLTLKFYSDAINPSYLSPFWRSIWYGLATTAFSLILAYPVVYAAVKIFQEYEVLILLFSVLPFWVMYLIRMFGWISILKDGGLIDEIVVALGLGIDASFLYSAPAVVLGLVFSWYPLMVFPLYASIKSLDDSLIEASKDLGANAFHTFTRVTVPETKSGIIAGSILVFVPSFGSYVTPILLGGPNSSQMLANVIGRQFRSAFNWPLGAALAVLMILIVIGCLIIMQRYADVMEVNTNANK